MSRRPAKVTEEKRRKAIPKRLRALVSLRQAGRCVCRDDCTERLTQGFHIDHNPPLELREWDAVMNDTIPPANDIDHLFGLVPAHHIAKTSHPRGPHTSIDSDQHAISKGKRIRGEIKGPPKRKWPRRKFGQHPAPRVRDINDD